MVVEHDVIEVESFNTNDQSEMKSLVAVQDFELPDPAEIARRAELTKKMMAAACKVLSYKDITNQGGNPYIDHYGCKKIANLFGLITRLDEEGGRPAYRKVIKDSVSNEYEVFISGRVWHIKSPENYEFYEGSASSFDDFFRAFQETEKDDETGKKTVVSAKFLSESKVQEKAVANFLQRAIKKKLGLQFTWEELEEHGIDKSKCKGFNFNSANEAGSADLQALRDDVWKKIVEICQGNVDLAKKTLKAHTVFKDFTGHTDINKVKESQLKVLAPKVNKEYDKFKKELETAGDA